jgi:4-aminobutyrate aminotransferase / (S)-3-amino-2-methylpropionate transaminase / 5-aminovalerate transaminase
VTVPSVEERLIAERTRMRPSATDLRQRVESYARGPRSREILLSTLESESLGHLDFALFTCPPVIERGEGARLWDVDGNEYVDCHAGFTVAALGHANKEVNEAIATQLGQVMQFAELPLATRAELSRRMAAKHPGSFAKKVFYAVTGGEAIEIAIKLARWYTGKPFILTHFGDYHGRTAGAMALTSKAFMNAYNWPIPAADQAVIRLPFAYCYRCPYAKTYPECDLHCASEVDRLFQNKEAPLRNPKANVTNVAAFVIEPFQASAGYIIPPMEYLTRLAEIAAAYDVLFVADEVQCGMGRSGRMWAIEHANVEPDLITMAKSLSNGLPISMVTGRAEIMDSMGPGGHSTTFAGYPAATAGANKVLDIFERDDIVGRAGSSGSYFLEGLHALQASHPSVGDVQGKGLFLAIELVRDRSTKQPADTETGWVHQECLNQGLICISSGYFSNRLCLAPPLVIDRAEIDKALMILDRVIGDMERKFSIVS